MIQLIWIKILWLDRHEQKSPEVCVQVKSMNLWWRESDQALLCFSPATHVLLNTLAFDRAKMRDVLGTLLTLSLPFCFQVKEADSGRRVISDIKWWNKIMFFFSRISQISTTFSVFSYTNYLQKHLPTHRHYPRNLGHKRQVPAHWDGKITLQCQSKSLQGNLHTGMPLFGLLIIAASYWKDLMRRGIQHAQRLQELHPQSLENTFDMLRYYLPMPRNIPVKFGLVRSCFICIFDMYAVALWACRNKCPLLNRPGIAVSRCQRSNKPTSQ